MTILDHTGRLGGSGCVYWRRKQRCEFAHRGIRPYRDSSAVACPKGYEPDKEVLQKAGAYRRRYCCTHDPFEAASMRTFSIPTCGSAWGRRRSGEERQSLEVSGEQCLFPMRKGCDRPPLPARSQGKNHDEVIDGRRALCSTRRKTDFHTKGAVRVSPDVKAWVLLKGA
jgi:hypothetical protein